MKKLPKVLLTISLAGFAVGFVVTLSGASFGPVWTVALPTGAIFFGLFLIAFMLQNEMAAFDEEENAKIELAERRSGPVPRVADSRDEKSRNGKLKTAHSH